MKKLHSLHRLAMKAALKMNKLKVVSDQELLKSTGQCSILTCAMRATAMLAWKCSKDWEGHPLTGGRIKAHLAGRSTRQNNRTFPPQELKSSIIHCLVEIWEKLPDSIRTEEDVRVVKKKIKEWTILGINV
jgi:hypothetical protein